MKCALTMAQEEDQMAGTVADYVVIPKTDDPITVSIGGDTDDLREFDIPSSALVGLDISEKEARGQLPVLSLMVNHVPVNQDELSAQIKINDKEVFHYGPTSTNLSRAFQEVLLPKDLNKGKNTLEVKVLSGKGTFSVSDIVIWFQNQV
jgi:hypothetical protein